ncbi:MAG: hypothetical protein LBL82_04985 [Oscillospiraceae bacterium]|nr:hypothetical protein [Oscillospiraceae bacterium]
MKADSAKITVSGITIALGLVVMMLSFLLPTLSYSLAMIAGGLLIVPLTEFDRRTAFSVYFGTSALSFILPCDKEAALMYVFIFGLYPIISGFFFKLGSRWLRVLLRLIYFNLSAFAAVALAMWIFGIPVFEQGAEVWLLCAFLLAANAAFVLYDVALGKFMFIYMRKYSEIFRKIFHIDKHRR